MIFTLIFLLIAITGGFMILTSLLSSTFLRPSIQRNDLALVRGLDRVLGKMTMGTTREGEMEQELVVLFDTGSDHTWVVASEASEVTGEHRSFDGHSSKSFTTDRRQLEQVYGNGRIVGYVAKDKITLKSAPDHIVVTQEFGMAVRTDDKIFDLVDAILGLNLVSKMPEGEPESFLKYLPTKMQRFGFNVKNPMGVPLVAFGDQQEEFAAGTFSTHRVVKVNGQYNGWNVRIKKFKVGKEKETEFSVHHGQYGQFVSGYSGFVKGPKDLVDKINKEIFKYSTTPLEEGSYYQFKTTSYGQQEMKKELPELSVVINDQTLTFTYNTYINMRGIDKYKTAILGHDLPYFIFGKEFLKEYYTRFDYEKKKVSIAKA